MKKVLYHEASHDSLKSRECAGQKFKATLAKNGITVDD